MTDSFATQTTLEVDGKRYKYSSLTKLGEKYDIKRLPYSMKILLENLLRHEDGLNVTAREIEAVANWDASARCEAICTRVVPRQKATQPSCVWTISWPASVRPGVPEVKSQRRLDFVSMASL